MNTDAKNFHLLIGLPAYNEEANLPALLQDIQNAGLKDYLVLVIDDGSSDRTAAIAEEWAQRMPLRLHRHEKNLGLGATIRHIYELGLPLWAADGCLVTMDADGSHRPQQIPEMLAKAGEGYDLVIASRYTQQSRVTGVPLLRRFLSFSAYMLIRLLFGIKNVRDYTCGFRLFRADLLRRAMDHYRGDLATEPGFAVTVEVLIKLLRIGAKAAEIGMDLRYDLKQGKSKIRLAPTILQYFQLFKRLRSP